MARRSPAATRAKMMTERASTYTGSSPRRLDGMAAHKMLSELAIADIRTALADTAHGAKGAVVTALAARYGVSPATVYRLASVKGAQRKREPGRPEYRKWVKIAVRLSHRAPQRIPLDSCIESGIASGALPPEAADMPIGTAHRIAREAGLRPGPRRTQRMHADYPMQAVQFDGSTSKHLTVGEPLADGDWMLHLHRSPLPASGYKNKPLADHRMRLLIYGIWDMCTGYKRARYVVAKGENAADSVASLIAILTQTGDAARPLHGLPDNLWSDQGALFKTTASRELLGRLGVAWAPGPPGVKERMGGVEQGWMRKWQRFEGSLFLSDQETIKLSEINARLARYEAKENARCPARISVFGQMASRTDAWIALTNGRPEGNPLREVPENAMQTLHREGRRRVDRNGIVRWEGEEYESKEWHAKWVTVRQALDAPDILTLEDPTTGERTTAARYQPRHYGDVKGITATALDKLLAEAAPVGADPYAESRSEPTNVSLIPARSTAAEPLDNPLDASRYLSIEEAMAAFKQLYPWPLCAQDYAAVRARIEAGDRDREAVALMANTLLTTLSEER